MSAPPPSYNHQPPPPPHYQPVPPVEAAPVAGNPVSRFFGGPPIWVLLRLALLSIGVGLVLSVFGIRPWNLIYTIQDFFEFTIANLRYIAGSAWGYFLVGAAVVFPIWLISRLFSGKR